MLTFERTGRGGAVDAVLTVTLDGEMINANMDFAQFDMSGSGKKQ